MQKLTFIHTADLHIDTPFKGLGHLPGSIFRQIQDSTFQSFERIVTVAINHQVDFVLIAGDLYDGANRSLKAQLFLRNQFQRLDEVGIEVFAIHGNHDHLGGEFVSLTWPENVHFFDGEKPGMIPFTKEGETLAHIYGYSYPRQAVTENVAATYSKIEGAPFHIALLHGTNGTHHAHDTYAPFSLSDLKAKSFDYWALGHIHKRSELAMDPPIIYSGNIQGLNRKESGAKGCYMVDMSASTPELTFIETAPVRWETVTVEGESLNQANDLIHHLEALKEKYRKEGVHTLLTIKLTLEGSVGNEMQQDAVMEDILLHLQDGEEEEEPFIWIDRIDLDWKQEALLEELGDAHFVKEILHVFDDLDDLIPVLEPLLNHRTSRRFIPKEMSKDQDIIEAAEKLLVELMMEGPERQGSVK
ncbi:DNA repair exonuclease [Pseudalkalibacillus sp. SCS-8]|uniref:metallophosphoesterase family protein n=1 Tax=Pseudalkalibacillus nanhaiensis TaxID=3115291 RepID=UPI0032DA39CE